METGPNEVPYPESFLPWTPWHNAGLLKLGTVDILCWIILCCGGNPAPGKMFSNILGLHALDVRCLFSAASCDNQKFLPILLYVPQVGERRAKSP